MVSGITAREWFHADNTLLTLNDWRMCATTRGGNLYMVASAHTYLRMN
jgi:hypothetical protein